MIPIWVISGYDMFDSYLFHNLSLDTSTNDIKITNTDISCVTIVVENENGILKYDIESDSFVLSVQFKEEGEINEK